MRREASHIESLTWFLITFISITNTMILIIRPTFEELKTQSGSSVSGWRPSTSCSPQGPLNIRYHYHHRRQDYSHRDPFKMLPTKSAKIMTMMMYYRWWPGAKLVTASSTVWQVVTTVFDNTSRPTVSLGYFQTRTLKHEQFKKRQKDRRPGPRKKHFYLKDIPQHCKTFKKGDIWLSNQTVWGWNWNLQILSLMFSARSSLPKEWALLLNFFVDDIVFFSK